MIKYFLQIAGLAMLWSVPFCRASPHGGDGGQRNVLRQCRVRVALHPLSTLRLQTCSRMPRLLHHQEGDHV